MAILRVLSVLIFIGYGSCSVLPISKPERIVGGFETTIESHPFMASIQYYDGVEYFHLCGATVISSKFLLTSGFCKPEEVYMPHLYVRVGSSVYNEGGQLLKVNSFLVHDLINGTNNDYDFGLIGVGDDQTIELGDNVKTVALATGNDPPDGILMDVLGWGITDEDIIEPSKILKEVDLPHFNQQRCKEYYTELTENHICVGGTSLGGAGACVGDSGGPAVINGLQYGIVSGAISCSAPRVPQLFARVASGYKWIAENANLH